MDVKKEYNNNYFVYFIPWTEASTASRELVSSSPIPIPIELILDFSSRWILSSISITVIPTSLTVSDTSSIRSIRLSRFIPWRGTLVNMDSYAYGPKIVPKPTFSKLVNFYLHIVEAIVCYLHSPFQRIYCRVARWNIAPHWIFYNSRQHQAFFYHIGRIPKQNFSRMLRQHFLHLQNLRHYSQLLS